MTEKDHGYLKKKAIFLRRKGWSYNEIKKKTKISKSTLSYWLKSIPLKSEHRKRLYTRQIHFLSLGASSQKERRARQVERIIEDAAKEVCFPLSQEVYRLLGAVLYWAEGSKTKMFEFTNSDPCLIVFMIKWINKIIGIPSSELKGRLNIYPQQNEKKIKQFWSTITNIPIKNFGKSYVKPLSKGYKKNNLYYGTFRIEVPKSVDIRYRTYGWIKGLLRDIEPDVQVFQKKWKSLKTSRPVNLRLRNSIGRVAAS